MALAVKSVIGDLPSTMSANKQDWRARAAEKKAAQAAKIPAEWRLPEELFKGIDETSGRSVIDVPRTCGLLTADELRITEDFDATGLVEQLAAGALKALDVAQAFCKRAAVAHQVTNCLTEIFFEQGLERARVLDEYFAREKKPLGPLHGLPISLKDSMLVKDVHHTCGYISFLDRPPASNNSPLVQTLLDLGAVLYVKTNVPQTFMTADSDNNVFGRTLNPRRLSVTAGGSSGGEGALIAMRGSLLGIGTDIGGSIRIPSLCNGIYGFKPTVNRIPFGGNAAPGRLGTPSPILPLAGPLAVSARDCELLLRAVISSDPWLLDDGALGVPWRSVSPTTPSHRKLRIGLITEEPRNPLHPPVLRALRTAAQKLADAGHAVVPLDDAVPSLHDVAVLAWRFFGLDPQRTALRYIEAAGEPVIKSLPTTHLKENDGYTPDLDALFDMNVRRRGYTKVFHDLLVQNRLDVILMPPYCATAVPHDTYSIATYTVLANMLDWPAVVLPFQEADEAADRDFVRHGVTYSPPYRPEESQGLPCSLQLLGRPLRDEELARDLEIVEKVLRDS